MRPAARLPLRGHDVRSLEEFTVVVAGAFRDRPKQAADTLVKRKRSRR